MHKAFVLSFLPLLLLSFPASTQTRPPGFPKPPAPADRSSTAPDQPPPPIRRVHADPLQLQREAKEMLELSQSLQLDIEQVNHGLLPKDTIEKLKRIEKLSKHLRSEVAP
jgi:hypothetical protein